MTGEAVETLHRGDGGDGDGDDDDNDDGCC